VLRTIVLLTSLIMFLSSCATFYNTPASGEPAATFVEKVDKNSLGQNRTFSLAEIDGKPVSHMLTSNDNNAIRVQPGTRRMLFRVDYRNDFIDGQFRAYFGLELNVEAGKRYQLGGTVSQRHDVVITLTDLAKPDTPWVQATGVGRAVVPGATIGVAGGGFVTIQGKE